MNVNDLPLPSVDMQQKKPVYPNSNERNKWRVVLEENFTTIVNPAMRILDPGPLLVFKKDDLKAQQRDDKIFSTSRSTAILSVGWKF